MDTNDDGFLDIETMLESGDEDLIAYAKEMQKEQGIPETTGESADDDDATQSVTDDEDEADQHDTDSDDDEQTDETDSTTDSETPSGVQSKDGKHTIPYHVLEETRRKAAEAESRAQEATQRLNQITSEQEKLQRQLALAKKQGIEMPELPEDEEVTDEMVEELAEISPELGVMARKLKLLVGAKDTAQQTVDNAQEAVDDAHSQQQYDSPFSQQEIQQAINDNPALVGVMQDDSLRPIAQSVEKALAQDPKFASLEARYIETVKRVGGAVGRNLLAEYGMTETDAPDISSAAPESLSDLPNANDTATKSTNELLAGRNANELAESMEDMSDKQLQDLIGM